MDRANNDARMSQLESCQLNINKALEALEQKSTTDVNQLNALKQQTEAMINQLQGTISSLDQKVNNTLTGFSQKLQSVENNILSHFNQQPQQQQPQQPTQPNQPQPVQQQNPQQPAQPVQQPVQQNANTQDNSSNGILAKLKQSAANLNNTLSSINQSISNATNVSNIKTKVVNMIDKAGDNIADTAKNLANTAVDKIDKTGDAIANTAENIANKATNIGTNIVNGVKNMQQASNGNTITKYEDIPDYLKRRFQYIKFYLENSVLKNGRGISTPVIYAYNIPANLFENFNAIFVGMNSMVSGIGKLLSSAKINTNLKSNDDAAASNKTIVTAKNQIGQAISTMAAALKTQNAMVLDVKEFNARFDQFDKSLDTIGNSSQEINKLLPVILNAQENNNEANNQNKNRINNLLKLALDGSNYFLKSYQQLNLFYEQTLDKYLSDEIELQNFYFRNNHA
jgi:hypothetical protein